MAVQILVRLFEMSCIFKRVFRGFALGGVSLHVDAVDMAKK